MPFYEALADKLLTYSDKRDELHALMKALAAEQVLMKYLHFERKIAGDLDNSCAEGKSIILDICCYIISRRPTAKITIIAGCSGLLQARRLMLKEVENGPGENY